MDAIIAGTFLLPGISIQPAYAQKVAMCDEQFTPTSLQLSFPCEGKTTLKTAQQLEKTYTLYDNNQKGIEEVYFFYTKYENPTKPDPNIFEEVSKAMQSRFEKALKDYTKLTKASSYSMLSLKPYEPELGLSDDYFYGYRVALLKGSGSVNIYVRINVQYYFKHGLLFAGSQEVIATVNEFRFNDRNFATSPSYYHAINEPYVIPNTSIGLSFQLSKQSSIVNDPNNGAYVSIDKAGVTDAIRSRYKIKKPILIKKLKTLSPGETFTQATAGYIKGESGVIVNPGYWKANPAISNIIAIEYAGTYSDGTKKTAYPYRILFECGKTLYEMVVDKEEAEYRFSEIDKLIKTMRHTGNTQSAANNASVASDFNRDLLSAMEAWLKDQFASAKGKQKPYEAFSGVTTNRFETSVKLESYPTEIVEEGMQPSVRRDWVARLGSFDAKDAAQQQFNAWYQKLASFKHEMFQLKQVRKTGDLAVWVPTQLHKDLPSYFEKMEMQLYVKERFFTENGKMKSRYELLLALGSSL